MYNIKELVIIFMIYSFLGWVGEVVGKLIFDKKFINRGFLIGPYCPIYGVGAILMIILLQKYEEDPFTYFIMSVLLFSTIEYLTSFILEKLFNARWWDYTKYKFNINGRICLETMIPFGLIAIFATYIVNPILFTCLEATPELIINVISILRLVILLVDIALTTKVMVNIKGTIKKAKKDNTEEITQQVKDIIMQTNKLMMRIIKSFPRLKIK